jgi:hypothetical protein
MPTDRSPVTPAATQIPSSPSISRQLATPPSTPEKKRPPKEEGRRATKTTVTPTRVGKILRQAGLSVPSKETPETLAHALARAGEDNEAMLLLENDYAAFVAQQDDMQQVDAKAARAHFKRCLRVASYLPLGPPSDTTWSSNHEELMALLFSRGSEYGPLTMV